MLTYTGTGGFQNSVAVPAARAFHRGIGSRSFYSSVTIDQPAKATSPLRLGAWEAGFHNFRDADAWLRNTFDGDRVEYAEAHQEYQDATVVRAVVFVDSRYFVMADRVQTHLTAPRVAP